MKSKKAPLKKITKPVLPSIDMKELKYVKLPILPSVLITVAVMGLSFYLGTIIKIGKTPQSNTESKVVFTANKNSKPKLDFYVMSFCPYGNEIETVLKPVYDLIGKKADLQPHYIFDKIDGNLAEFCKNNSPDPANCPLYVQNSQGQLKDVNHCKQEITKIVNDCNDEKKYLKIGDKLYTSLHGRVEANQNVREICAFNLAEDKKQWWDFVANVNQSCNSQNADTCWEEQAKKAGLDTAKINDCFNKDAASLIEKEIALTNENKVQGSPTLFVNGQAFPPETAYTQDGKGTLTIGKKSFTQDLFRTSNVIKEAICASFKNAPKECKTDIAAPVANEEAPAQAASCN
jgi:hypothetical protein